MIDYRLKFANEVAAKAALPSFTLVDKNDMVQWLTANHRWSLDPIGPCELVRAVIDPVTMQVTTPAVVDLSYHVNIRLQAPDETLDAEIVATGAAVTPKNPRRVWA